MRMALGIALLGGLGALCRYLADLAITKVAGRDLPFGTMGVNILGCTAAGVLLGATDFQSLSPTTDLLVLTGFFGGFTTASAIGFESARLMEAKRTVAGLIVIVGTMTASLIGGAVGLAFGQLIA